MERKFLLDVLADGPKTWKEIVALGKDDGFKERTLERARAGAGLINLSGVDGNASTRWARPSTSDDENVQVARPLRHFATDLGTKAIAPNTGRRGEVGTEPLSPLDKNA